MAIDTKTESLISSAGGALLLATARTLGLPQALSREFAPWRVPRAVHDPGKVVLDLAIALALGGDALCDIAVVRAQPALFGLVASDPTVSRLMRSLATDTPSAVDAISKARAVARAVCWDRARPVPDRQVMVDLDATLVTAHSEKEHAAPNYKRGFGFHPLLAFADHTTGGTGEPLAVALRPGNATANNTADHITVLTAALQQLPEADRARVVVRTDSAGGSQAFLHHITDQRLHYSIGIRCHPYVLDAIGTIPARAWHDAIDADGQPRDGAQVIDLSGWLPDMTTRGWPAGMRVIVRRERPHPGAQLRLTDADGWRITVFATNTPGWDPADLEARHRLRARAEDRIRGLKDTGLRNLPLHDFTQNTLWCQIVLLAADLLAWTQTLAFARTPAQRWEPKRLRLRILHVAGRLITTARRHRLRLPTGWPWNHLITDAWTRLTAIT